MSRSNLLVGIDPRALVRIGRFVNDASLAAFPRHVLVVDPPVGLLHAHPERRVRFPSEIFLDQRIVAVPAVHSLWGAQIVFSLQLNSRNRFRDVHQLIDGHCFA